jgi:protein-tyrosine-phosphatase
MAEAIMHNKIKQSGLEHLATASAGTHVHHSGIPPVPEVQKILDRQKYPYQGYSRQLDYADFNHYDYIFAMDRSNLRFIQRHNRGTSAQVHLLLVFTGLAEQLGYAEVIDPYPDGDFEGTFQLLSAACERLSRQIIPRAKE